MLLQFNRIYFGLIFVLPSPARNIEPTSLRPALFVRAKGLRRHRNKASASAWASSLVMSSANCTHLAPDGSNYNA